MSLFHNCNCFFFFNCNEATHYFSISYVFLDCEERNKYIENGGVTFEHFDTLNVHVGMKATYFCNVGYVITGSHISTCLSDGSWSELPPNCTGNFIFMKGLSDNVFPKINYYHPIVWCSSYLP